ncbi:hypothetical protein AB8Z38_34320 [Bradyrhizobium sp. LLZ17]|uniref:Uncharacterized protein n=1 Tax=Bradyrhizobium sp. LLZ17 TaxID=3239388 RepID=A0AB39XL24_9BRAD
MLSPNKGVDLAVKLKSDRRHYGILCGKSGAVDRHLQKEGKMVLIETSVDVQN